jgi:putative cardiolipin synthase
VDRDGVVDEAALAPLEARTQAGRGDDPKGLAPFIASNRKMILFHGDSDGFINPFRTVRFYQDWTTLNGGYDALAIHARLFMSGTLLFEALHDAAKRGVRVRLLLDDNNTSGLDRTLAALDAHPNIEVRLFNPFVIRTPRWIGYLTDFSRLNRRMHNKSFTADNQVTLIGGRNIGDEYFDATEGTVFVDLDVMAVGQVVKDVSNDFDRYWASRSSYPVDRLLAPADPARLAALAARASLIERDPAARAYTNAVRDSPCVHELAEGRLTLEWAATRMVSDDPAKGLGLATPEALLPHKLKAIIGEPATDVELVSAYFVPTAAGVEAFTALAERGVRIRVLTNSLEATDVALVHAGYAKRRKPLLEVGITLYEMQLLSPDTAPTRASARSAASPRACTRKPFRWIVRASSSARSIRSALGEAEHRLGLRHREPGPGAANRSRIQ